MTHPFTESDLFEAFSQLKQQLQSHIIGQPHLIERLLIALLADGHLLVEGPPGLAKTKAIQTLSSLIEADFQRIQFTPDLLPSDITGTDIYRPETHSFEFQPGPIFHNLILAKMQPLYKGHAKQFMHAFWGAGQMSFVKHAIFVDEKAPKLENYEVFATYVLNRITPKSLFITEGILDALDHSSPENLVGGKLGIDATAANNVEGPQLLGDDELLKRVQEKIKDVVDLHQFMQRTNNPITVISVHKSKNVKEYFDALLSLSTHMRIVVFVDANKNDIYNSYMLIWRVTNNMDAQRDIYTAGLMMGIDGTNKNSLDNFTREWPDDVDCTQEVVENLRAKGLWDLDEKLNNKFQL